MAIQLRSSSCAAEVSVCACAVTIAAVFVCATRSRLIESGRILSSVTRSACSGSRAAACSWTTALLAGRRVERTEHRPFVRTVGAHVQIGVALRLAVGQSLRIQHRGGIARDRREPDLDADARLRVALARDRVEQLGAVAQIGVVDRRAGALVGVEQLTDQARCSD